MTGRRPLVGMSPVDFAALVRADFEAACGAALAAAMVRGIPKPPGLTDTWAGLVAFDARPIGVQVRHHPAKEEGRG